MPTDTLIQSLAQGGYSTALALLLCCLIVIGAFVALGIVIDRHDRRRQRELDEQTLIDRRPDSDGHWADKVIAGGRHDRARID